MGATGANATRHLAWDGCANARDLGGLPTRDGGRTRWGAAIRSDSLDGLRDAGWAALHEHGVRTVVDLRDGDERAAWVDSAAYGVTTIHLPLEDLSDVEFWLEWRGVCNTALYYRAFLDRFPERSADLVAAFVGAAPGGVLFHCQIGRDRTGLVALLLLALAGVAADDIADDHALSDARLRPYFAASPAPGPTSTPTQRRMRATTSERDAVLAAVETLDVDAHLRAGGLGAADIAAARARLTQPA